ncbi:hypothetical protein, partial [Devosia sp. 66-22]|uniref:hypothetical protein n=1 Tax=Devosia sp. 66-22 TaxID=1895753 RepID=UPI00260F7ACD
LNIDVGTAGQAVITICQSSARTGCAATTTITTMVLPCPDAGKVTGHAGLSQLRRHRYLRSSIAAALP